MNVYNVDRVDKNNVHFTFQYGIDFDFLANNLLSLLALYFEIFFEMLIIRRKTHPCVFATKTRPKV